MTKTEEEIIALLAEYPAIRTDNTPYCNIYTIGSRKVRAATLERMIKRGLITIGIHPTSPYITGFVVVDSSLVSGAAQEKIKCKPI